RRGRASPPTRGGRRRPARRTAYRTWRRQRSGCRTRDSPSQGGRRTRYRIERRSSSRTGIACRSRRDPRSAAAPPLRRTRGARRPHGGGPVTPGADSVRPRVGAGALSTGPRAANLGEKVSGKTGLDEQPIAARLDGAFEGAAHDVAGTDDDGDVTGGRVG